jgi:hypothetical protein
VNGTFSESLEAMLRRARPRRARKPHFEPATPEPVPVGTRRQEWFAKLAATRVIQLLDEVAKTVQNHGGTASSRLVEVEGPFAAEFTLNWGRLPRNAKPPRLTVYLADNEPPLMVEYTGALSPGWRNRWIWRRRSITTLFIPANSKKRFSSLSNPLAAAEPRLPAFRAKLAKE